jgi:hypothetical protein
MCVWPINLNFLSQRKFNFKICWYKVENLCLCSRLLIIKLIARNSYYFKTFTLPFIIEFNHFLIVIWSKSSFAGHVNYHGHSFFFKKTQTHLFAPNVFDFDVKYISRYILDLFWACLPAAEIEDPADASPKHNKIKYV